MVETGLLRPGLVSELVQDSNEQVQLLWRTTHTNSYLNSKSDLRYMTPGGNDINKKGITPDVLINCQPLQEITGCLESLDFTGASSSTGAM